MSQSTSLVAVAVVWREDQVLLVRQQGPGDPVPSWSLPGGVVEAGELLTAALERELLEETGLTVGDVGSLAYVVQVQDQARAQLHDGRGSGPDHLWTTFVFEISTWTGDLEPRDPDGLVLDAVFLPVNEALRRIEEHPIPIMREPSLSYLRN